MFETGLTLKFYTEAIRFSGIIAKQYLDFEEKEIKTFKKFDISSQLMIKMYEPILIAFGPYILFISASILAFFTEKIVHYLGIGIIN